MRNPLGHILCIGICLGSTAANAAFLYTFSDPGAPSPYSFSLLEPNIINTTGAFAIPPFQLNGLTFSQATLAELGGVECFEFGTAGASLSATATSCALGATSPQGGSQSLFFGAASPGAYTALNVVSEGSAPAAPNHLTITSLPAFATVPEPSHLVLLIGGLGLLALNHPRRPS